MSNFLLGTLNRLDSATLSGGSWLATLPLSNLKDRRLSRLARSSDEQTTSTTLTLDLGSARNVGIVALVAHNLSVTSTVRVLGDDAADFATPIYDSGAVATYPDGVIPADLLEWEDDNFWLGTISQEAIAGLHAPYLNVLPVARSLRYWRIEINDTANPDGYVHLGRLYIGEAWSPEYNRSYGASLGYDDISTVESSLSGEEFFDVRRKRRTHRFDLGCLSKEEALDRVLQMQRLQGTTGEILIVPDRTDTLNMAKVAFLGRLKSLGEVAQPYPQFYSTSMEITEII